MDSIITLINRTMERLRELGLKDSTVLDYFSSFLKPIQDYYEAHGLIFYSESTMEDLRREYQMMFEDGVISKTTLNKRIRGTRIIDEINMTGSFEWKVFTTHSLPEISTDFEETIIKYIRIRDLCEHGLKFEKNLLYQFTAFICDPIPIRPTEINVDHLLSFIKYKSCVCKNSLDKVMTALSKYVQFLYKCGILENDISSIVRYCRPRNHYVQPALEHPVIEAMIQQIDTSTSVGKRDKAIFALGCTTGLRAGDLVSLELKDIDWKNKEITIIQGKTSIPLHLPLQEDVCNTLADYILNARPKTDSKKVFIRSLAPYTGFKNGIAIGSIFRRYLKKAGITHELHDGKTFHGIRRMLGTEMVSHSVALATVAQVLGHQSTKPTRQYISIDIEGMRRCALPLSSLGETL